MPARSQFVSATANASCIASSARSNDPETRMSAAMIRPDSSRKTRSTALRASAIQCISVLRRVLLLLTRKLPQRADLDAAFAATTARWDLGRPGNRLVKVFAIKDVVAGQLFFGFGKRPISRKDNPIFPADSRRRRGRMKRLGPAEHAPPAGLIHYRPVVRDHLLLGLW